jgi:hypothetical protein
MESFAPPQALAQWPGRQGLREGFADDSCCLLPLLFRFSFLDQLSGHRRVLIK